MKKLNILSAVLFVAVAGGICTSCADKLDLSPIDYYGSGSYWKTEAHVIGYMDGIHKHLRDVAFQHTFLWGEALRGELDYFRHQFGWHGYAIWRYQIAEF